MENDDPDEEFVSPEAMRDALLKQLYTNRADLKGVALVQGIKALRDLIPPAPPVDPDDGERFSMLEQVGSLPPAEARRLLVEEIARLEADLAEHQTALEALDG